MRRDLEMGIIIYQGNSQVIKFIVMVRQVNTIPHCARTAG